MMFEDVFEYFRGQCFVVYFLIVIPVSLALVPQQQKAGAASLVQEFTVFRLQHFDLKNKQYGSRAWRVNFEAVSLGSRNIVRRCLVGFWQDFNPDTLHDVITNVVGSVLIVMPENLSDISEKDRQALLYLEEKLLERPFSVPIYIAPSSPPLLDVVNNIMRQSKSENGSALNALSAVVLANGFHLMGGNQASSLTNEYQTFNIIGKLNAHSRSDRVATIAIIAHYDSFGMAPGLAFGADSNGSGVALLMELLRIFSKLYKSPKTRSRYNIVFLLSAGGKFNYQGARQWLDEYIEQSEAGNNAKLELVICLDSLGKVSDALFMHVSIVPKETSSVGRFFEILQNVGDTNVTLIKKKINVGGKGLYAWEHERFARRKVYACTLSHYENYRNPLRISILDNENSVDSNSLHRSTEVIAEALVRYVFDLKTDRSTEQFLDELKVEKDNLVAWMRFLVAKPRATQLLATPGAGSAKPMDSMLTDLLTAMEHYAHEAQSVLVKTDKREPDFVLYGAAVDTMFAYRVKPAIFDLILALVITGYLGLVYLFVVNAATIQVHVRNYLLRRHVKQS